MKKTLFILALFGFFYACKKDNPKPSASTTTTKPARYQDPALMGRWIPDSSQTDGQAKTFEESYLTKDTLLTKHHFPYLVDTIFVSNKVYYDLLTTKSDAGSTGSGVEEHWYTKGDSLYTSVDSTDFGKAAHYKITGKVLNLYQVPENGLQGDRTWYHKL